MALVAPQYNTPYTQYTAEKGDLNTIICEGCRSELTGYVMTHTFQFVNGLRVLPLRVATLSCGCEIIDPDHVFLEDEQRMYLSDDITEKPVTSLWKERAVNDDYPFG